MGGELLGLMSRHCINTARIRSNNLDVFTNKQFSSIAAKANPLTIEDVLKCISVHSGSHKYDASRGNIAVLSHP